MLEIVARVEGTPPKLVTSLERAGTSELDRLRHDMGDPSLTAGRRNLVVQQYRVAEALAHKEAEDAELLAAFLEHIFVLQRDYLLRREPGAWADAPLGTLAGKLGCPLIALPRLLKDRGIAVGDAGVPLDDLVGVERFVRTADELGYVKPDVLVPTDSMRSRAVVDALLEVFQQNRQFILDPVLVVPHPVDAQVGYVCEGNHRTAAAHLAQAPVRIRLLKSKQAIQFYLSGTQAARLAESSSFASFVGACEEQAALFGYRAGSWNAYLDDASRFPVTTSHAVKILTPASPDDTSSDALRSTVMELFEGLPGRVLSAQDVEERLVLMGVPRSTLPKRERLETYLRHGLRRIKEVSPGQFSLES
ncbi:MAG TPA: hypothetical protein VF950_14960 [Planctomycetota bacterium]